MFGLLGPTSQFTPTDAARLRRVEAKLDLILAHLGLTFDEPAGHLPAEVRELADRGDKIGAIRVYRGQTGAGLAEAKRVIDDYLAGRG